LRCWAKAAQAARPASLASSARAEVLEASHSRAPACSATPKTIGARVSIHVGPDAATFQVGSFHSPSAEEASRPGRASGHKKAIVYKAWSCGCKAEALRRGAKPNARGRTGTSCFAARAGGFGLLAGGATQRTMLAGHVLFGARSNPSIERTCPGKPGQASHLKR
jgi:hypothetical protein